MRPRVESDANRWADSRPPSSRMFASNTFTFRSTSNETCTAEDAHVKSRADSNAWHVPSMWVGVSNTIAMLDAVLWHFLCAERYLQLCNDCTADAAHAIVTVMVYLVSQPPDAFLKL